MPKKLQIKLLSQSGELVSMTNCSVGQISVLRAESPSELRPYQRALGGNQGRERFIITVDGREYNTEEHNLIGFGEVAPHTGLTVGQYLASVGLIEGAISGLLMAYGIEGIETKLCSALSPDEERKVRLFAATADPSKVLILNEPFEPISSSWRERIAELLAEFVRTKDGLIVISSLSYRPDSWIDNPSIARHQVGQSLRKTIGFGGAGSESNQLMNQLRDQLRKEEAESAAQASTAAIASSAPNDYSRGAATSLGAAAMMGGVNTKEALEGEDFEDGAEAMESAQSSGLVTTLKAVTAATAGGLGVWAAITLLGIYPPKDKVENQEIAPPIQAAVPAESNAKVAAQPNNEIVQPVVQEPVAKQVAPVAAKVTFVLDRYPEAVRVSLLDTSRGIMGDPSQAAIVAPPAEAQKPANNEGNFYKLLESAGSDKPDAGPQDYGAWQPPDTSWSQPESSEPVEYNQGEEEERREAIRQKFLEAIRAAAERREEEGMGQ